MTKGLENWKTQIRKGYLDLCILAVIEREKKIYGLELLQQLERGGMPVKEGTLYPLLNRLTEEGVLAASWVMEASKGHPRKFYALTKEGTRLLAEMREEFSKLVETLERLGKE